MHEVLPRRSGKLIAIEGIDQSGKMTQTQLLAGRLHRLGHPTSIWNFPDYRTPLGRQLKRYLTGSNPLDFHVVHMLYAANRWERAKEITRQLKQDRKVLVNRYSYSNFAYGTAHGLQLSWLVQLEEGLPKADLVLVLDVVPKTSFERKRRRRDVHEENLAYLAKVRSAYLRLAKKFGWEVIDGERAPGAIHSELWRVVSRFIR